MRLTSRLGKASVAALASGSLLMLAAGPAQASATGTNNGVYISLSGGPGGWTVSAANVYTNGDNWGGHIQIIGPNGFSVNGPDMPYNVQINNVHGTGAGEVCAIGWDGPFHYNGATYYDEAGEPCVWVS